MRNIFLLTLMALFFSAFTQSEEDHSSEAALAKKEIRVPGYIIKKDGTKQEGSIIPGSVTDNEVKVTFVGRSGKKQSFKPKDLLGYGYEAEIEDDLDLGETDWVHYEVSEVDYPPKPFGPKVVFMQRESEGALSLFCYYIEQRNNPKKPYRYIYYLKDNDGKISKVDEKDFKKVSKSLFKEYTAMSSRIGRKDFLYKNLDRMVNDYNYWVANQHDAGEYRVAMKN